MTTNHWGTADPACTPRCGAKLDAIYDMSVQFALNLVSCPICLELIAQARAAGNLPPVEPQHVEPIAGEVTLELVPEFAAAIERPVTGDDLAPGEQAAPAIDLIQIDDAAVDPNSLFPVPPQPKPATEEQLMRIGVQMPEGRVNRHEIDRHIEDQRRGYALYSKDQLIEELCRRDTNSIRKGQEAQDGRMAGRMLREFVRGILYTADKADLDEMVPALQNSQGIEKVLKLLGAEPAGLRDLRLNGGTTIGAIGPYGDQRSAEEKIQDTSDLSRRQLPSQAAADQIRNREN